jgi:DNA-binding MarR family transcriptional regulator
MQAMRKKPQERPQPAPDADLSPCNCLSLRQAARHVTQLYDRHMAPEGLGANQYSILSKLARLGPLSINQLAGMMVMDRTTMGRAVRPMVRDKLLAVGRGEDGRTRMVRLTPAGEARFKSANARWKQAQREFEAAYGAAEAEQLRAALARVVVSV